MNSSITSNIKQIIKDISLSNNLEKDNQEIDSILNNYKEDSKALLLIEDVLKAEKKQKFFQKNHFKKTLPDKRFFNYRLSIDTTKLISKVFPKYNFSEKNGILKNISQTVVNNGINKMKKDGYLTLNKILQPKTIESIKTKLEDINFRNSGEKKGIKGLSEKDLVKIKSNICSVENQQDIINIPEIQELLMDSSLLTIIQEYLGAIPILAEISCWWSINYSNDTDSLNKSAQMFHQDKDFISFVKVFIYLNDVKEDNGPHTYVIGSFKDYEENVPENYRFHQRLTDEYLLDKYGKEKHINITGEMGTLIIEDTTGFHKGTPVKKGHRLLIQLEYCSTLYFYPTKSFTYNGLGNKFIQFSKKYPRMFINFDNKRYLKNKEAASTQVNLRYTIKTKIKNILRKLNLIK